MTGPRVGTASGAAVGPELRPPEAWIAAQRAARDGGGAPDSGAPPSGAPRPAPRGVRGMRDRLVVRRTIRGRLIGGFSVALVALLASGALGIYAVTVVHRDLRASMLETAEVGGRLARSNDAALRFVALAQARLLGGAIASSNQIDSLAGVADSLRQTLLTGTALTTDDRKAIEQVGALQGRVEVRLAVAQAFVDVGRRDDASREAVLATASLDTLVDAAAHVAAAQERRAEDAIARVDRQVEAQRLALAALFAAGLMAAVGFGVRAWRAVTFPLERLTAAARALGAGDLTTVPSADGLDEEYHVLTEAFAQMAVGLRAVLRDLEQGATEVAATAEELAAGAEETNAAAEQVAGAASSIATAAAAQTASLETIATAAGRSALRAAEVATYAEDAEQAAERVTQSAATGTGAAEQALERMAAVGKVTDDAVPAVAELTDKVKQIGAIADTIGEIARQTNLLALNAAIEAARAGEQGRGFAVVANEVKKLASQTEDALDGINRLTREVRAAAERTSERFAAVRDGVAGSQAVVHASSAELARIAADIVESRRVVAAIAAAARDQRTDVAALTQEIDAVVAAAEENASTSEEVSAVVEQQAASVAHVTESSQHLATVAARLKGGMERFALGGATTEFTVREMTTREYAARSTGSPT
ncbi:MAG TPA: HAMP domain-containing methyl-accepting chemotaxis protein [Gemmatimonadaceae bacterium]|nr:HAMP domain-containing methyl-accepting chemotaxis protein [Gemmatimonadaceae bacterium]